MINSILNFLIIIMASLLLVNMAEARGRSSLLSFCQTVASESIDDSNTTLHYFEVSGIPFCEYGSGVMGAEALLERVQHNRLTQAEAAYLSNKTFICSQLSDCKIQSGARIDDQGKNVGEFYFYSFSDGSMIGKDTLNAGPDAIENTELNRALKQRSVDY